MHNKVYSAYSSRYAPYTNRLSYKMKILIISILSLSLNCICIAQYVLDSTGTCRYWMPFSHPSFKMSWTGECNNNTINGSGTLIIGNNDYKALEYNGNILDGKFTGRGKLELWQTKYVGNFTNGHFLNLTPDLLGKLNFNPINQVDSTNIFSSQEATHNLSYYILTPTNKTIAVLVLFPSLWERPELVFSNNRQLCELAMKHNIAIIVPSLNYNICLTEQSISFINNVFRDALQKYNLPKDKFILGGFSQGGMNSLRYSELAFQDSSKTTITPKMVFGIDPPVDFISIYNTEQRTLKSKPNNFESKNLIEKFDAIIGGSPNSHKTEYQYFSIHSEENSNAKFLKNIPVRIYCDPDIDWWMENRQISYIDMNAVSQTSFILYLNKLGNNKAEFINRLGMGYRLGGKRHPHSWNLLDPEDCVSWILQNIN